MERLNGHFSSTASTDERLDMIEMIFGYIQRRNKVTQRQQTSDLNAVSDLNTRFQQAALGYQMEGAQLIRIDSKFAHSEVVLPALVLLGTKGFEQADRHFRDAHKHYRHREYAAAITEAGKAFEAALKAVCAAKSWKYESGATAGNLVTVVVKNGLFPAWLGDGLTTYVAMMKTGLPTVRNETGAHGAAPDAEPVHENLARYALHMSASNLLLVMEAAAKT